ncbi:hypothetical protein [Deinococcus roseus]|uniref:Uncharacterized protein n=1 Tax=Deinococcus roseus TaxID=392414 RepID=A0ABQ2CW33_9DEIO|nr:hypothetical protein [Deinococcus roseus]GGJ26608.1 hypothetical protein GCM10008938_10940 [Deinococcus roseus]
MSEHHIFDAEILRRKFLKWGQTGENTHLLTGKVTGKDSAVLDVFPELHPDEEAIVIFQHEDRRTLITNLRIFVDVQDTREMFFLDEVFCEIDIRLFGSPRKELWDRFVLRSLQGESRVLVLEPGPPFWGIFNLLKTVQSLKGRPLTDLQ